MRQPNYVGFSKTGSDTTIEPNFDEKTASDLSDIKKEECQSFCHIKLANLGGGDIGFL